MPDDVLSLASSKFPISLFFFSAIAIENYTRIGKRTQDYTFKNTFNVIYSKII
jgi:hypothetical protein